MYKRIKYMFFKFTSLYESLNETPPLLNYSDNSSSTKIKDSERVQNKNGNKILP